MALAIKVVPTLEDEEALRFEMEANKVESNPHSQDYTQQAEVVRTYLNDIQL